MDYSAERNDGDQPVDMRAARRAVLGGSIGNFMVFYELYTYGYLAVFIGTVFFPTGGNPFVAFLAAFVVYALTYVMRPAGALILGRIADRRGRRPVLIVTIIVMAVATALLGLLPTYAQVGVLAPVLLVLLRLLQGFFAAGEFGGAVSLMAEFAPERRRGLWSSWQSFTIGLAILTGSGITTVLTSLTSESQMLAWGWRIPFLLAAIFGVVALYIRSQIDETPIFRQMQQGISAPSQDQFQPLRFAVPTWVLIPFVAGAVLAWTAGGSVFLQILPSYASATSDIGNATAQLLTFVGAAMFTLVIPFAGWLSDFAGRRAVMLTGAVLVTVLSYPAFVGVNTGNTTLAVICVGLAGGAVGMMAGPGPAMMAELFSATNRATGVGFAYNLQEAIFGGLAGLIIGGLRTLADDPQAAAYYTIIGGLVSIACLTLLRSSLTGHSFSEVEQASESSKSPRSTRANTRSSSPE